MFGLRMKLNEPVPKGVTDPVTAFWKALPLKTVKKPDPEVISRGFEFAIKTFSLSIAAQMKILGAFSSATLSYPIVWNTIDDLDTHQLDDAEVESGTLT